MYENRKFEKIAENSFFTGVKLSRFFTHRLRALARASRVRQGSLSLVNCPRIKEYPRTTPPPIIFPIQSDCHAQQSGLLIQSVIRHIFISNPHDPRGRDRGPKGFGASLIRGYLSKVQRNHKSTLWYSRLLLLAASPQTSFFPSSIRYGC